MKILIKNATVVTPTETARTSVLVEGSAIADIDPAIQTTPDETVDAAGLHLIPGVVDDQVHFRVGHRGEKVPQQKHGKWLDFHLFANVTTT